MRQLFVCGRQGIINYFGLIILLALKILTSQVSDTGNSRAVQCHGSKVKREFIAVTSALKLGVEFWVYQIVIEVYHLSPLVLGSPFLVKVWHS